jgi:hypothetical protein
MSGTSLRDFVLRAVEHKRKRFGDLRRLQRDILPARITTREQAKVLIALDSSVDERRGCTAGPVVPRLALAPRPPLL